MTNSIVASSTQSTLGMALGSVRKAPTTLRAAITFARTSASVVASDVVDGRPVAVIAFGGNALLRPQDHGTQEEQFTLTWKASRWLVEITAVSEVGPYLDATVTNERFERRFDDVEHEHFAAAEAFKRIDEL